MGNCIKLTNQQRETHNGCVWTPGEWNPHGVLSGVDGLCSGSFYHAYDTEEPLVALFLNPIHGAYEAPLVWKAAWRGKREDDGALKFGATEMRIVEPLNVETPTTQQRVSFAILVALSVYQEPSFVEWADRWLSGEDRSRSAAESAERAARSAAERAAWSAAYAEESARSAARSAERAAWSAECAAWSADLKTIMEEAAAWARVFG